MFWFCFKDIVIPCNIFHQPCWTGGWKDFETKKRNSINGNASETNIYFGHKSSASEGCECVLIVQFISILHFFVIIVWKKYSFCLFWPFCSKVQGNTWFWDFLEAGQNNENYTYSNWQLVRFFWKLVRFFSRFFRFFSLMLVRFFLTAGQFF